MVIFKTQSIIWKLQPGSPSRLLPVARGLGKLSSCNPTPRYRPGCYVLHEGSPLISQLGVCVGELGGIGTPSETNTGLCGKNPNREFPHTIPFFSEGVPEGTVFMHTWKY